MTDARIRVLLVDDHTDLRVMLRTALEHDGRFRVVGEAASADQAVASAQGTRPDVILLDDDMPGGSGLDALDRIRDAAPLSRVVLFTAASPDRIDFDDLVEPPDEFIAKAADLDQVIAVLAATPTALRPDWPTGPDDYDGPTVPPS